MIQKDKQLLLRDLCSRLPYGVKGVEANTLCLLDTVTHFKSIVKNIEYKIEHLGFKPYLFPLSSMTEEQKKELRKAGGYEAREEDCGCHSETFYYNLVGHENVFYPDGNDIDWLNKNHFDYRGLIPKGLALDATGLNIY